MPSPSLQPLYLLTDEPIDGHADDFLGRHDDARTIAEAVLGTTGPFSIGIYGEWGTGKTSLLHHVRSLLEHKDDQDSRLYPYLVTVMFNAWQHEGDEHPLAYLAEAIQDAIMLRLKELEGGVDTAGQSAINWLRKGLLSVRATVAGLSAEVGVTGVAKVTVHADKVLARAKELQEQSEDLQSKAWKGYIKSSITQASLRGMRSPSAIFKHRQLGDEGRLPRIVVFIDDMDRCMPEEAFKLLQCIKLALSQPGFIFVMSLDTNALRPFLQRKHNEHSRENEEITRSIYLDKLVQLPYPLRVHEKQFGSFVDNIVDRRLKSMLVAPHEVEKVAHDKALAPLWQVFHDHRKVLAISGQKNPRTLIRHINRLLVDARLAPASIKNSLGPDNATCESVFLGLCLIRETVNKFLDEPTAATLSNRPEFCKQLADAIESGNSIESLFRRAGHLKAGTLSKAEELRQERRYSSLPEEMQWTEDWDKAEDRPWDNEIVREIDLLGTLTLMESLWNDLFRTGPGLRWLRYENDRELVETFFAVQPEVAISSLASNAQTTVSHEVSGLSSSSHPAVPRSAPGASTQAWLNTTDQSLWHTLSDFDQQSVARTIRRSLKLPANAAIREQELASVTSLRLTRSGCTDAILKWVAHPQAGLTGLKRLIVEHGPVTDDGIAALASPSAKLSYLSSLYLLDLQITDRSIKAIAAPDTALRSLSSLMLFCKNIGDEGIQTLAAPSTGLSSLTRLYVTADDVTNRGVKALAATDSGLSSLADLFLSSDSISDESASALAAPNTGLSSLTELALHGRALSPKSLTTLVSSASGLRHLSRLTVGENMNDPDVMEKLPAIRPGLIVDFVDE